MTEPQHQALEYSLHVSLTVGLGGEGIFTDATFEGTLPAVGSHVTQKCALVRARVAAYLTLELRCLFVLALVV